jgi:hypothetical protein
MFAAIVIRPDIIFAVLQISSYDSDPSQRHLAAAEHVLRYLKGTVNFGIVYNRQSIPKSPRGFCLNEVGHSDADWGRDLDSWRSTTGLVVLLNGAVMVWKSYKQPTVTFIDHEIRVYGIDGCR